MVEVQPGVAQLAVNGLVETLTIALGIGLLQQLTQRIEVKSAVSARTWLKQGIALIDGQRPVGRVQRLQEVLLLIKQSTR
ncbi:hypothetical protein D3C80_1935000 [compost metagenome]